MRKSFLFLILLATLSSRLSAGAVPAEMAAALKNFRTEGPQGWAYTQTTEADGERLVERFDPLQPDPYKWTLVETKGRPPAPDEAERHRMGKVGRSSAWNAPRLEQQLDMDSCETLPDQDGRLVCRFSLRPDEAGDEASRHLQVTFLVERESGLVRRVEIASKSPFSPVFGVSIKESMTVLEYGPSAPGLPPLLLRADLKVRGRAYWLKSLDQEMHILWSEHLSRVGQRSPAIPR